MLPLQWLKCQKTSKKQHVWHNGPQQLADATGLSVRCPYAKKRIKWYDNKLWIILCINSHTHNQTQKHTHIQRNTDGQRTKFNVLVISKNENDVWTNVSAIPLKTRPQSLARKVHGSIRGAEECQDEDKEKCGRSPPNCHDFNLSSTSHSC